MVPHKPMSTMTGETPMRSVPCKMTPPALLEAPRRSFQLCVST
jgi:hypothetical protein